MAKKFFTDDSLNTFVSKIKSYIDKAISTHQHRVSDVSNLQSLLDKKADGTNGVANSALKLENYTIESDVPANAKFTDTVYTHPSYSSGTASEGGYSRTLNYGGSFNIPYVTFDSLGHVTSSGKTTIWLPSAPTTAESANTLKGLTSTVYELNYMDGVTSNVQTQFNSINNQMGDISSALDNILGS